MAFDIYAAITDRIIDQLSAGVIPWHKPWNIVTAKTNGIDINSTNAAISYSTGKPYSPLNQMLLGKPGEYITFKQALDNGGNVRKGAKSRMVVFWKFLDKEKKDSTGHVITGKNGQPVIEHIPMLKYYNVFHLSDCENVAPKHSKPATPEAPAPVITGPQQIEAAEAVLTGYISRSGVTLYRDKLNDSAYYQPGTDTIVAPHIAQYQTASEYYSTLFHECAHSTGHPKRLNRDLFHRFGSADYAKEELTAEITAAAILHGIGIETPDTFRNSAAYVQNWIQKLQNDKRMIVSAAGRAEKAANYITGQEITTTKRSGDTDAA